MNYAALTNEQLLEIIELANNELAKRIELETESEQSKNMSIQGIQEKVFESVEVGNQALISMGLAFYGKTPDKRGKRNFTIFTDETNKVDYHVSYDVVKEGFKVSIKDVTDQL